MLTVEKQRKYDPIQERDSSSSSILRRWRGRNLTNHASHRHRDLRRSGAPVRRTNWILALAERLCDEHPEISTESTIYDGNPHIKNVRLTVGNVLAKLYIYGSVKVVADIYAPHVSEAQIKEAIAYAQDFLEEAIHAGKSS